MGAAGSVNCELKDNVYISYAENDVNAGLLHDELINSGHNMIKWSLAFSENNMIKWSLAFSENNNLSIDTISHTVNTIMKESSHIIICVSEKTVCSFQQAIEIDHALNGTAHIIYVMTDAGFTPLNTPYLNGVVKCNKWLPAYDNETLTIASDEFDVLLEK